MPDRIDQLTLAFAYPNPGEKTPHITLHDHTGNALGCISTRDPLPCLPVTDESVLQVIALDVLEHVHDEQAWLAELARVLVHGGEVTVRVPLENWMAWADALNVSRYLSDIFGIGEDPIETIPTGWHRHYAPSDLPSLLGLAGFEVEATSTEGTPVLEIPHLAALLAGSVTGHHEPQRWVHRWRERLRTGPRLPLPTKIAHTITVRARKQREGFRPEPNLDHDHRPEKESTEPLE
ncbi:MAG: methyltransferase domain-containing protein [Chloroflexota bacterium]|nr:methyltransferase domain-containing protein [Chloroflexota bacterium]